MDRGHDVAVPEVASASAKETEDTAEADAAAAHEAVSFASDHAAAVVEDDHLKAVPVPEGPSEPAADAAEVPLVTPPPSYKEASSAGGVSASAGGPGVEEMLKVR